MAKYNLIGWPNTDRPAPATVGQAFRRSGIYGVVGHARRTGKWGAALLVIALHIAVGAALLVGTVGVPVLVVQQQPAAQEDAGWLLSAIVARGGFNSPEHAREYLCSEFDAELAKGMYGVSDENTDMQWWFGEKRKRFAADYADDRHPESAVLAGIAQLCPHAAA